MTADAVGGVWVYASSLAVELARRGWRVTLVTLGPAPRQDQVAPLLSHTGIDLEHADLALEWQDPDGKDRQRVLDYLDALEERVRPDIVHLNGYREALAPWRAPVVVAAHSCVGSWWRACRGTGPEANWQPYLADISAGLSAADRWVAPTAAFRDTIQQLYAPPRPGGVIWNGMETLPDSVGGKDAFILAAGRLWDEAKNIGVLPEAVRRLDWPLHMAGAARQSENFAAAPTGLQILGNLPRAELLAIMQKAGIFVSPAVYEPFGLTVLEAAASRCALVLSDIATFRELWAGAALFVNPRDPAAIEAALTALCRDASLRQRLQHAAKRRAARYTIAAKADAYQQVYTEMLRRPERRVPLPRPSRIEARA